MTDEIMQCRNTVKHLMDEVRVTDGRGQSVPFDEGFECAIKLMQDSSLSGGKLILIGNGASASISSHIATDFWRNVGMRAVAFNDASGLTCIANDFGYERVFEMPVEMFGDKGDVLIAISSSGKSKNILSAAKKAGEKGIKVITLSGFEHDNPLCCLGEVNFYVPSHKYGQVEVVHHFICHSFIDVIMEKSIKNKKESV